MDDFAPFESAKTLIDGAKENIVDFETACQSFVDGSTYKVIRHQDPNTRQTVINLRFDNRIAPRLRWKASSILNDLRHSLDHAMCDAAISLGRADSKGVHFPFAKSASELPGQITRVCKHVDADLISFVKAFNPYYGGDNFLYTFSQMANPNKHQRLLRVSLQSKGGVMNVGEGGFVPGIPSQMFTDIWNELRNQLEIARITPISPIDVDFIPNLQIILLEGEAPFEGPAAALLSAFASKAEGIVLGIEAETKRIIASRT